MTDETDRLYKESLHAYLKLEKENAELKETVIKMNNVITETFSNLTEAKEILKKFLDNVEPYSIDNDVLVEAEQFLNREVEK